MDLRVLMIVSNDVVHDARVLKEARALRAAGHEVTILGWDRSGAAPGREPWDGTTVVRIPTGGSMRLLPSDVLRNPVWWGRAYRLARSIPFDVVHCHDLDTLPVGVRLKQRTGRALVYDCHEVFGYMIEEDVPGFVTRSAFLMERQLAPMADQVISVNPAVQAYIDGVTGRPSVVVQNCEESVQPAYRPPPPPPFTVVYIGTLHRSRFVLESIEAAAGMPDIRLVLGGSKALTETVRQRCAAVPNAQFLGLVPREEVMPRTLAAHVVLSMFDPRSRINQVGYPNKIYEAMAAGRPSLVTQGLSMAGLVERNRCGLSVPYSVAGFREGVSRLRDDPGLAERLGRNGLEAAQREYNWAAEAKKLVALYDRIG
jgi:glycosyltransferase involved in cell wall biosynthesis